MNRIALAGVILLSLTSCSGVGTRSQPLVITPTGKDWDVAASRLRSEEQAAIRNGFRIVAAPGVAWDGNIYGFRYGPPNGRPIGTERLNLSAICGGYNERFAARSGSEWRLDSAVTFVDYGATEGGTQIHTFELHWTLSKAGRMITITTRGEGPGIKIIWGASPAAIAAEANQAFALTFLQLVLQLENAALAASR